MEGDYDADAMEQLRMNHRAPRVEREASGRSSPKSVAELRRDERQTPGNKGCKVREPRDARDARETRDHALKHPRIWEVCLSS